MYKIGLNKVYEELKSSKNGISNTEAKQRLNKYGKNELEKQKKQSFIVCFFKQFLNIMVAILLFSAVVSLTIAIINQQYSDLFEGLVILFIVIMNAFIGVFQENKAQACIDDLQKYNKTTVNVIRDGNLYRIDSSELVPGDVVEIEAGNILMADVRLIETINFSCDESSLTGESVPVEKDASAILKKDTVLGERINMAFSGCAVTNGKAKGIVVATGRDTELGHIAKLLFNSKKEITPLQKSIDKIGKIITWFVLFVCAVILVLELVQGHGVLNAIMTSVALAVAAIPESLPAVITIIMALGVQQLAKRKSVIKHLHAVETLGSCEIICSDKTGTLTQNKMQVVEVFVNNQFDLNTNDNLLLKCMKMCNSTKVENKTLVGEPTEKAIYEFVQNKIEFCGKNIYEIPFNSTRKMMTVVVSEETNQFCYTKGAPEMLLEKCKYININNEIIPLTNDIKTRLSNFSEQMTNKALRVIGFAYKNLNSLNTNEEFEENLVFLGFAGLKDNPRPEVKASIEKCFKAGLKPVMITGDHKNTAFAIAKEIGIAKTQNEVITGAELDKYSDKELASICSKYTVYARVSPEHKVRIVKAYKRIGKVVAMTGDGVNDAPSLKIADIGVGMGKSGTDVIKNVADMVVTDDNFATIVVAVEEGRKVYSNIQKALIFLISTNCVEVFGMVLSLLFFPGITFLMPAQMLYINLVTDSLPAFALGMEKVEKEVMMSPPRNTKAGLFGGKAGISIIYQSILQTAIVMAVFLIGIFCYSPEVTSTMVFFTIIFMQLLHSVNCKTYGSIFENKLFNNKTFNICFAITLMLNLSVALLPFMYTVFGLELLNMSQWIVVFIASIIIIPFCELFKVVLFENKTYYKFKINKQKI